MKKITGALLTLSALLLCSCKVNAHADLSPKKEGSDDPAQIATLESFQLKDLNKSMVVNETYQLSAIFQPVLPELPEISYKSSNPNVVSVDASKGKLTAKSLGFAIITAKCGDFSSQCYVSVTEEHTFDEAKAALNDILAEQKKTTYEIPDYLDTMTSIRTVTTKLGKTEAENEVTNEEFYYERMVLSQEDAYIAIEYPYSMERKTAGANPTYSGGKWIFYCNDEYETFIFHESGGIRRYILVDCSKYLGKGKRIDAANEVIGLLFNNGSKIVSNNFETVAGSTDTNRIISALTGSDAEVIKRDGQVGGDGVLAAYTVHSDNELIDLDYSRSFGIPSGIYADINDDQYYYYYDNYCRYVGSEQEVYYDWRGNSYVMQESYHKIYDIEKKDVRIPDIDAEGWVKGEDIFDI